MKNRRGAFDILHQNNLEPVEIPDVFPNPIEIAKNLPGSVVDALGSGLDLLGLRGAESRRRAAASRVALGEIIEDVAETFVGYPVGRQADIQYPHLSGLIGGVVEETPFGSGGWSGFARHLEQNPAEWIFDVGLMATGAGAGAIGARRAAGMIPDTPAQAFARQWTEVDPASVYSTRWIDSPETHAGGKNIDDLNAEMSFVVDDFMDFLYPSDNPAPAARTSETLTDPIFYNRRQSGAASDPAFADKSATEIELDREAIREALERHRGGGQYRERYMGTETSYEITPEGDYNLLAQYSPEQLAARTTERHSRLRSHVSKEPEIATSQGFFQPETSTSKGFFQRVDEAIARRVERADRAERMSGSQGHNLGDYHSGEIRQDHGTENLKVMGAGAVVVGTGSGIYAGWQRFFGGGVSEAAPQLTETERVDSLRLIEGGGKATEKQLEALRRMYPEDEALFGPDSELTKKEASELFDTYVRPEKMASESQITALTRMYPGRDLSGLTMAGASELFDTYQRPARSNEASAAQLEALNRAFGTGEPIAPANWLNTNISDGISRDEASHLFASLEVRRALQDAPKSEVVTDDSASDAQIRALEGIFGERKEVAPANWLNTDISDGISRTEASHLFASAEVSRTLRDNKPPSEPQEQLASPAQIRALGQIFGGGEREEVDPANWLNTNISDGITRTEASHLFRSSEVAREMKGPKMASESQMFALRRAFPEKFRDVEQEEQELIPLEQINVADGVTAEEAREMFKHVKESPPPMATRRQVARLEAEFPHAFKRIGQADSYLESGQSYGIVQSLEDIYDADTFTGRLVDTEGGRVLKEDTVRLGDFNAPEIKPDRFKPREYQEREAARAREARDVFRSLVERFNVGRDVDEEGYVIPIQYRQDSSMPGGLERGFFGRVLGDVNFEDIDYEQFMIQQGMGSVYGAEVEWGAEEIDAANLWRRTPTYTQQLGKAATNALWDIPGQVAGGLLEGGQPDEVIGGTLRGIGSGLKQTAISQAKSTAVQATTDWFKERFTDEFTPNNLGFVERYIGDLGGFAEKAKGFGGEFAASALAPIALAAGTFYLGERSLDKGYEEVIGDADERENEFYNRFRNRDSGRAGGQQRGQTGLILAIERAMRKVLRESSDDFDKVVTRLGRKMKVNDFRGQS